MARIFNQLRKAATAYPAPAKPTATKAQVTGRRAPAPNTTARMSPQMQLRQNSAYKAVNDQSAQLEKQKVDWYKARQSGGTYNSADTASIAAHTQQQAERASRINASKALPASHPNNFANTQKRYNENNAGKNYMDDSGEIQQVLAPSAAPVAPTAQPALRQPAAQTAYQPLQAAAPSAAVQPAAAPAAEVQPTAEPTRQTAPATALVTPPASTAQPAQTTPTTVPETAPATELRQPEVQDPRFAGKLDINANSNLPEAVSSAQPQTSALSNTATFGQPDPVPVDFNSKAAPQQGAYMAPAAQARADRDAALEAQTPEQRQQRTAQMLRLQKTREQLDPGGSQSRPEAQTVGYNDKLKSLDGATTGENIGRVIGNTVNALPSWGSALTNNTAAHITNGINGANRWLKDPSTLTAGEVANSLGRGAVEGLGNVARGVSDVGDTVAETGKQMGRDVYDGAATAAKATGKFFGDMWHGATSNDSVKSSFYMHNIPARKLAQFGLTHQKEAGNPLSSMLAGKLMQGVNAARNVAGGAKQPILNFSKGFATPFADFFGRGTLGTVGVLGQGAGWLSRLATKNPALGKTWGQGANKLEQRLANDVLPKWQYGTGLLGGVGYNAGAASVYGSGLGLLATAVGGDQAEGAAKALQAYKQQQSAATPWDRAFNQDKLYSNFVGNSDQRIQKAMGN
jgi:hypothetical protein